MGEGGEGVAEGGEEVVRSGGGVGGLAVLFACLFLNLGWRGRGWIAMVGGQLGR